MERSHPWRARFITGLVMILLSLAGLIMSTLRQDGALSYWRVMVPVFALLCLWLSWYLRTRDSQLTFSDIWHELLHWAGLLLAVYLISLFVNSGVLGRFEASLQVLTLLAFALFVAGIYIEFSFIPIGILLGLFAAGAGLIAEYLYTVMIPLTVVAIIILFLIVRKKTKE